jgi:hypothetical protein
MKKLFAAGFVFMTVFCFAQNGAGDGGSDAWKKNWIYAGARLGGGVNIYALSDSFLEDYLKANGMSSAYSKYISVDDPKASFAFNGAAYVSAQITDLFAAQLELMYTHDETEITATPTIAGYNYSTTVKSTFDSFLIPVLAKVTHRPKNLSFAGLAGIYFTVPVGKIKAKTSSTGSDSTKVSLNWKTAPVGFMLGGNAGIHLGPGVLLGDIRYAVDFVPVESKNIGGSDSISLFNRNKILFTIGYEMGFMGKAGASGDTRR